MPVIPCVFLLAASLPDYLPQSALARKRNKHKVSFI